MSRSTVRYAIYTRQSTSDEGNVLSSCDVQFEIRRDFVQAQGGFRTAGQFEQGCDDARGEQSTGTMPFKHTTHWKRRLLTSRFPPCRGGIEPKGGIEPDTALFYACRTATRWHAKTPLYLAVPKRFCDGDGDIERARHAEALYRR